MVGSTDGGDGDDVDTPAASQVGVEAARDLAEVLRIEACGGRLALLELHSAKLTGQGVREMAAAFKAGACPALKVRERRAVCRMSR